MLSTACFKPKSAVSITGATTILLTGLLTQVKEEKPKPGLSIIPDFDTELIAKQKKIDAIPVCKTCGKERDNNEEEYANCKNTEWIAAVM